MSNILLHSVMDKSENRLLYWISISGVLIVGFFCLNYLELFFCLIVFGIFFTFISYMTKTIILTEKTVIIQSIFGKDIVKDVNQCKSLKNSWFLINVMELEFIDGNSYLFKGKLTDEVGRKLIDIIATSKKYN